ncbi:twin-arginine translocation pathway signal [Diaphorobacter sp. HDW4A]|uniref:alginate O-acetyltransferase AlgX-related protein n=1 Tax=Diaphorobacter sp. HDW4A TaxID=2714924 RepID=UPI0035301A2C
MNNGISTIENGQAPLHTRRATLRLAAVAAAMLITTQMAWAQNNGSSLVIKGKDGWLFAGWGSLTQVDTAGIDRTVQLVAHVNQQLKERNIDLLILMLPDKVHFYADKLPDGTKVSPAVEQRYALIQNKLQRADIQTFDNFTLLKKVRGAGADVFYRTDQHWTLDAADATAQGTADLIRKIKPQLSGTAGTGTPLGALAKERRYGDLAEIFLTPEEKKQIGREVYTVRRQAEGQGLLDDAPAPVHVTGHSMVQPYFGYPQKLSNLLDRPVSLNWKPGNIGPWVMLLEYLESSSFKQTKPQVLVWQMFEPNFNQGPDAAGLWDNAAVMPVDTWTQRVTRALGSSTP